MAKFKPGDKVLIKTKVIPDDWDNSWVFEMDACVGKFGKVILSAGDSVNVLVELGEGLEDSWHFPLECLALVVEGEVSNPNPKAANGAKSIPLSAASPLLNLYASLGKANGALKYGISNFIGTEVVMSIYIDAIMRHLDKFRAGEEADEVDGVPHLGAVLANIDIILSARAAGTLIDDRPLSIGYHEELKKLTPLIASLQELHKDRNPKHYYLKDKDGSI